MSEDGRGEESLNGWISLVYGKCHGENDVPFISRKLFIERTFDAMSLLVHYNKANPLIYKAVEKCPYLTLKLFTILTVLYGAYTCGPSKISLLEEFVSLLEDDLIEKEIQFTEYARNTHVPGFFPELSQTYEIIAEIYSSKRYPRSMIPPTVYHAYTTYVLQNFDLIEKNLSADEVFKKLTMIEGKWQEVTSYIDKSNSPLSVEIKDPGKLH